MNYLKKSWSLEEKALIKVAIDQCQESDFRETVLCLEKPTYGDFINTCYESDESQLERWDRLVEEHCQRLTKALPFALKRGVQGWINRIVMDYLSFCRRQEALFGLSRYFMMNFVTREDWSESGRLNEERLAQRLVKDERLTILQRYRIACVYCLQVDSLDFGIPALWRKLTPEERESLSGNDDPSRSSEENHLVLLWSYYMNGGQHEKVTGRKEYLWSYAIEKAVSDGNRVALTECWRFLDKNLRQSLTMEMAFSAFYSWLRSQHHEDLYWCCYKDWMRNLVSFKSSSDEFPKVQRFNLPFYYSDLLCFFLSEMSEEQQLTFFTKAFQDHFANYILLCFLDWPHQDYFLLTIRKLWGILPKYNYGHCLLILASKYSGDYGQKEPWTILYTKEDRYYDYQGLLFQLWKETPEGYKRYLFSGRFYRSTGHRDKVLNEGRVLLARLLEKYPFEEKEEELFKRFLSYVPKEERIAVMHSKIGEIICSTLTQREKWSFFSWLLEECLPANEIGNFKKQFIQSVRGRELCFTKLIKNEETWLKNLADWSFESNEERKEFKEKLIYGNLCVQECELLLRGEVFSEVERMIDFCLPSEEKKEKFKVYLARCSCYFLLEYLAFEELDRILKWCFGSEEKIVKFKKDIVLLEKIIDIHYRFIVRGLWENVDLFYRWFGLSAEELKKLKNDTVLSERCSLDMSELLYEGDIGSCLPYLCFCLPDEETIVNFKKNLESTFSNDPNDRDKRAKERLAYLIELLSGLKKDAQNKKRMSEALEEQGVSSHRFKSEERQSYSNEDKKQRMK